MKKFFIRLWLGDFFEVSESSFISYFGMLGISSSLDHDDTGYTMTNLYKLNGILIGYSVYDVCVTDENGNVIQEGVC